MDVIKYQCTYCNTLFDSADRCPNCGSLLNDAIKINYTQNIKGRKKELSKGTYFNFVYKGFCIVHLLTWLSWFGILLSVPTTILHIVHIILVLKNRKKDKLQDKSVRMPGRNSTFFTIISIIDMVACLFSIIVVVLIIVFAFHELDFMFY